MKRRICRSIMAGLANIMLLTLLVAVTAGPAHAVTQAGITWTIVNESLDLSWNSITYGNGTFVAVSYNGIGSRVMTSSDGVTWTRRTSAVDNQWMAVTYGNGLFVAVANTGAGNRVMTSPDGIAWTSRTTPVDNQWTSVTYGNGQFVAVSQSGTGNRVMTSPDGITWTNYGTPINNNWQSVTYGNGQFVAVANSGTGTRVMTSSDGMVWTTRTSAADNSWKSVVCGGGLFVAVSSDGSGNRVMTSPDGFTWTIRTSAADSGWTSVIYGNSLFVAVAPTAAGSGVMTSPDGVNWSLQSSTPNDNWQSVTYGNGQFTAVAISGTGNRVMTSSDGYTWTARTYAPDLNWASVAYGNGLFAAVANNGTGNRVITSPDGITWTSRTSAADNNWTSVAYGEGLFVAVAGTGTGNRAMTSPDGITWTSRTSAADLSWSSVTYGHGLFVAVGTSGTINRVMTSPDGSTWTIRAAATTNTWNAVTYGNGLFVAVASTGTGNRVMTSPDGITWTSQTSAANNTWNSVTYGNGLFVAVASTGTGNRAMTSPDGFTWTIRTSAADNSWFSVIFGNGLFTAVAQSGTGNRAMSSPDGITWTIRASAADNSWNSVTYGNGRFVAVSITGTSNRAMISQGPFIGQTIIVDQSAPASAVYNSQFDVKAHAGSGLDVAVTTGGSCSGSGNSSGNPGSAVTITMTGGTGTCSLFYDQAGNTTFDPASQLVNVTSASKATQSITVTTGAPATAANGATFTVAAYASSALTVTYSSGSPTICTNSGATFTMVGSSGTCKVQYDQAGTANFNPATQVVENTTVQKPTPICTVTPYSVTYNGVAHTATGSCTGVGNVLLSGLDLSSTTHTTAGTYSGDPWTFTDSSGNYNSASGTVNDTIVKATPTASITNSPVTYTGAVQTATVACPGDGAATLASGGTGTNAGSYSTTVDCAAGANYAAASGLSAGSFVINKRTAICNVTGWSGTYDATAYGASGSCTGVGGSGDILAGLSLGSSFTSVPGGQANWTFTNANYANQSGSVGVTLSKATALCNVAGWSGAYDAASHSASGSCSGLGGSGDILTGINLGSSFTSAPGGIANWSFSNTNYADQSGSASITIGKVTPTITAPPTAGNIVLGQALSASTLVGGSGSVPGGFVWTTPATVPSSGISSQAITFNPTDTTNYTTATGSTNVTVLVPVTIATATPAGLGITADGVSYSAPHTFNWVLGSSHTISVSPYQNQVSGTRSAFASWSDTDAISHSITVPATAATYTANFSAEYQVATSANPMGAASVSLLINGVSQATGWFPAGAQIQLKAFPNSPNSFVNWTDTSTSAVIDTANPTTVTVSTPLSIAATTVVSTATPVLTPGSGIVKSGTVGSRTWTFSLANNGTVPADNVQIGVSLISTSTCQPTIVAPLAPTTVGTLSIGRTRTMAVTYDFSGCPTTKYTVKFTYTFTGSPATPPAKSWSNQYL